MKDFFYRCLIFLTKRCGTWIFLLFAWHVATGYFLFFPRRVAVSVRFYRRLFPERGRRHSLWCAWRQYHHFVHVFLDRLLLKEGMDIATTYEGWEHIAAAAKSGQGGIILMSHVGSWEIAAQLLSHHGRKHSGMRLLLYLGAKHREQIEQRQKKSIAQSGIRVVAVPEEGGSPMVTVWFAGGEARIPEIPYILALLSGAPLLIFFVYRTGKGRYHLVTKPPLYVVAASRQERRKAVETAAQAYADLLAETVYAHPYEWYHFESFFI
jgi:predicted LPLAT superfamily acyltransferase